MTPWPTASSAPAAVSAVKIGEPVLVSEPAPAEDAALVQASVAGDAAAARELVRRYHGRIFQFVCRLAGQGADAEDITQETFIKVFKSLSRVDTTRPLANWLFTIARRTAFNHFRGARVWATLPEDTASAQPSPAHRAEESDAIADVWTHARALLSPREYEVLWLRFGEELSTEETARALRLTVPNVKILVYRARQRLLANPPRS